MKLSKKCLVKNRDFRQKNRLTSYRYDLLPLLHSCPG
ncbi:MAG: hypothetical protein ACI8UQ_000471, partial [Bacteroidia bacterium]